MTKKPDTTTVVAVAAVTAVTGLATYILFRTFNAVKKLEELDLDFGNDSGLMSMLNRKDSE